MVPGQFRLVDGLHGRCGGDMDRRSVAGRNHKIVIEVDTCRLVSRSCRAVKSPNNLSEQERDASSGVEAIP